MPLGRVRLGERRRGSWCPQGLYPISMRGNSCSPRQLAGDKPLQVNDLFCTLPKRNSTIISSPDSPGTPSESGPIFPLVLRSLLGAIRVFGDIRTRTVKFDRARPTVGYLATLIIKLYPYVNIPLTRIEVLISLSCANIQVF